MKIAIMTQPLGFNYGGIMQAWALQQVLARMGHVVVTIDRQSDKNSLLYFMARFGYRTISKVLGKRKEPINLEAYREQLFKDNRLFIENHIVMSAPMRSTSELKEHIETEGYDAIIVGSDQVWRPKYSPSIENYFLDFLENNAVRRIAYAASFGVDHWEFTKEQTARCRQLARLFHAVSVRERSAIGLCKQQLDVDANHVVDPTLLLDKEDYLRLIGDDGLSLKDTHICTYFLDRSSEKERIVRQVSSRLCLLVHDVSPPHDVIRQINASSQHVPSPKHWLEAFINAGFVVTDSFHGMVFSIIFNKPFIAIGNHARGLSRFASLAEQFGLNDRVVDDEQLEIKALLDRKIDWTPVNLKRRDLQNDSLAFLDHALSDAHAKRVV